VPSPPLELTANEPIDPGPENGIQHSAKSDDADDNADCFLGGVKVLHFLKKTALQ
jgi:hypothetical protein